MRLLLLVAVLGAAGLYGAGVPLFLFHADDPLPRRADAVVVLAGSEARLPVALSLVRRGVAPTLVVSSDSKQDDPARYRLCAGPPPKAYRLLCRRASPFSTRGEARMVVGLARSRGWRSIVVVSSRYHLLRAHLLFRRCTTAKLTMRGTDDDSWTSKALSVPLEWIKLARAETLQRDC